MNKTVLLIASAVLCGGGAINAGDWTPRAKNLVPLAPPIAEANCLSYDYVGLHYGIHDFGTRYMTDGDFYGGSFSKSLGSVFFLSGGYYDGGYEFEGACGCDFGVDTQRFRIGLGARRNIVNCIDLTFEGGAEHTDAEYDGKPTNDYDSWGYYVGPGIRARAGRFEMFAKALYTGREGDYSQRLLATSTTSALATDESGWIFSPGVVFHVTDYFGLEFAAEVGELDTAFLFGARYLF